MNFKKFPLLSIVLSIVGILLSVFAFIMIQVASKVNNTDDGLSVLAIMELVVGVLFLAALTAKKPIFTRTISIIMMAALLTATFVISVVCSVVFQNTDVTWDSVAYLSVSILTLVVMVLFFVYFLIGKRGTLKAVNRILNITSIAFFVIFAALVLASSFAGIYRDRPLLGIEMVVLLVNAGLFLGILLSLFNNLVFKDKAPKEEVEEKVEPQIEQEPAKEEVAEEVTDELGK